MLKMFTSSRLVSSEMATGEKGCVMIVNGKICGKLKVFGSIFNTNDSFTCENSDSSSYPILLGQGCPNAKFYIGFTLF